MNEVKKNKSDKKANQPVQKSTSKGKDLNPDKNKPSKGKSNGDVPDSPTTEVNPEG